MTAGSIVTGTFPSVGDVGGHSVVMHYGHIAGEYASLRASAMLIDRSARGRVRIAGDKAPELVTGLVTNDVVALQPGHGQYAAALNPKGKIVADIRIFRFDDHLLIDAPPRAQAGWLALVRKYINPRLAPYHDESAVTRDIGVFGLQSRRVVSEITGLTGESLAALAPYAHTRALLDADTAVVVARVPDLELEGYELFVPQTAFAMLWQRALAAGAVPCGLLAWEIARVEAGRPEWGLDIDESTIPQEANFDELHAISYTKGCYVGQEVVARVHFRGHVNRHLRGLAYGPAGGALTSGARLIDAAGRDVGDVRSAAISPRIGGIAIGMVRREVELGATLTVRASDDGADERQVTVGSLPFPL
jgi:folate-binding protein YgfZ